MANTDGIKNFALELQRRMSAVSKYGDTNNLEIGTITGDMGIKLDNQEDVIPKADYMICRSLKMKALELSTTTNGQYPHSHTVKVPSEEANKLKPGDRVLIGFTAGAIIVMDVLVTE